MHNILLVDDEQNMLNALRRSLRGQAYHVEAFDHPLAALERVRVQRFDLVISDYRMPDMDGITFLHLLREIQPDCVRMVLSGYADLSALVGAINEARIFRFIAKPWSDAELMLALNEGLEYRALWVENQNLADRMRQQQGVISRQEMALNRMAREHPGLLHVERDADGAIVYRGEDL